MSLPGSPVPCERFEKMVGGLLEHFSDRDVVLISPHPDDSVVGCGGLIYYLRNKRLWEGKTDKRPEVHVLGVMASPRPPQSEVQRERDAAERSQIRHNESRAAALLLDIESHSLNLEMDSPKVHLQIKTELNEIRQRAEQRGRSLTLLIPSFEEQHATHRRVRDQVLRVLREAVDKYEGTRVWGYHIPCAPVSPPQITVVLPLDKNAMSAKRQAIAMYQSEQTRTDYADAARSEARLRAAIVPDEIIGPLRLESNFVEVYHELEWQTVVCQEAAAAPVESHVLPDRASAPKSSQYLATIRRHQTGKVAELIEALALHAETDDFVVWTHEPLEKLRGLIHKLTEAEAFSYPEHEGNSCEILRQLRDTFLNGGWERYRESAVREAAVSILQHLAVADEVSADDASRALDQLLDLGLNPTVGVVWQDDEEKEEIPD